MKVKTKNDKEFITKEKAIKETFIAGMALGFELSNFSERVSPMLVGKKNPKEIEEIWKREVNNTFRRFEKRFVR